MKVIRYFIEKLGYVNMVLLKEKIFYLKYDQIDKLCVCTNINIDVYKKPLVSLFIAYWKMKELN